MKKYNIRYSKNILKLTKSIPVSYLRLIKQRIEILKINPKQGNGIKKLVALEEVYRLRVGNYRVIYEVRDTVRIVLIIRIRHRKDAYKT